MNKKLGVLIVIILLVLLGGGVYVMKHKSAQTPTSATTATNPTETAAAATQGTLKSLLTSGIPQTCTFSQKQATTTGTVYVSGGKMRGDFTSTNQGQTVSGHMIVDSGYSYVWTDQMKQGFKMALTEAQANGTGSNQTMDMNQNVSYSCKPWVSDASKFALPTDITFSTFTVPQAAPSGTTAAGSSSAGAGAVTSPCSACDSLPAAAQGACRTQLHCQ